MKLLSKLEAAEYLGQKPETLDYWRWTGKGPKYVKFPKEVKYRQEDVDAYIETLIVRPIAFATAAK